MEFEVKQVGTRTVHTKKGPVTKPDFESVEEAFERYACEIAGVPCEKQERVVEVLIPSAIQGGKPTKASQKMPCLPSPAHEICTAANDFFNKEQDISYRLGYGQGYKDKDEDKPMREDGLTLPGTHMTNSHLMEFSKAVKPLVDDHKHGLLINVFTQALQHKRDFGFSNGYWQGYKDKAGDVMPKFQQWEDPKEEAGNFEY